MPGRTSKVNDTLQKKYKIYIKFALSQIQTEKIDSLNNLGTRSRSSRVGTVPCDLADIRRGGPRETSSSCRHNLCGFSNEDDNVEIMSSRHMFPAKRGRTSFLGLSTARVVTPSCTVCYRVSAFGVPPSRPAMNNNLYWSAEYHRQ